MKKNLKLKAYRELLEISQQDMADEMGIHLSTYCNKENGRAIFNQHEMIIASRKIGKSVEDIFFNNQVTL